MSYAEAPPNLAEGNESSVGEANEECLTDVIYCL